MRTKKYLTNYRVATKWLNNSYVLCNNIPNIDQTIWDNMLFELYDENDNAVDIYQWYISDASTSDVDYLRETFGLKFAYSELLDCYILCVDHYGTAWDYVYCETTNEIAKRELGEGI